MIFLFCLVLVEAADAYFTRKTVKAKVLYQTETHNVVERREVFARCRYFETVTSNYVGVYRRCTDIIDLV